MGADLCFAVGMAWEMLGTSEHYGGGDDLVGGMDDGIDTKRKIE